MSSSRLERTEIVLQIAAFEDFMLLLLVFCLHRMLTSLTDASPKQQLEKKKKNPKKTPIDLC